MEKENSIEKEKLHFFGRLKKAIFNLEKYSDFVNEKLSTTIKFLCVFVLIFTAFQTGIYGYNVNSMMGKIANYVENNLTDFEFKEYELNAYGVSTAYDEENDFYFAMDTKNPEELTTYRDEMKKHSMGMVFTTEDAYVYSGGNEYIYSYSQLFEGANSGETLNRQELLKLVTGEEKTKLITLVLTTVFLANYPTTLLAYTLQILAVGLAVWITGKIMNVKLSYKGSFSIAVYSMVLSSIFAMIYRIINNFTEFRIVNFDLMYNIIIYIYAMFAVFMLKIDDIKQREEIIKEVRKIEKVQEEVHEEMQAAKEEKEEAIEENKEDIEKEEISEEIQEEQNETEKKEIEEIEKNVETKENEEKSEDATKEDNEDPIEEPKTKKGKGKKK